MGLFFASASEASITACAAAANAAGGGTVVIPAATITLTQPLQMYSSVKYRGTGWQPMFYNDGSTPSLGTILQATGTCLAAFAYNQTDSSTPPTYAGIIAQMLQGSGISDMTLLNFPYGIKIGAKYVGGAQWSEFRRLNIWNCGWGLWLENFLFITVEDINVVNPTAGAGFFGASGASALYVGNSVFRQLNAGVYSPLVRGWVFRAYASSTRFNDLNVHEIQTSRYDAVTVSQAATMTNGSSSIGLPTGQGVYFPVGTPVTVSATVNGFVHNQQYYVVNQSVDTVEIANQRGGSALTASGNSAVNLVHYGVWAAATMTNGSPSIALPTGQGVNFPVDTPVTVGVTANGFAAGQIYFVVSQAGDTIELSNQQRSSSVLSAAGNNAISLASYGFPNLEIVGFDEGDGTVSYITSCEFTGLDLEGYSTVHLLVQNGLSVAVDANWIDASIGEDQRTICLRNTTYSYFRMMQPFTSDIDASGTSNLIFGTTPEFTQSQAGNNTACGVGLKVNNQLGLPVAQGSGMLYLSGNYQPEIFSAAGSLNQIVVNRAFSLAQLEVFNNQTLTTSGNVSSFVYGGGGGETVKMPQIVPNLVGLQLHVSNPSSGTLTLDASAYSQTFNGVASIYTKTIAAHTSVRLEACLVGSSTYYWSVQ